MYCTDVNETLQLKVHIKGYNLKYKLSKHVDQHLEI
jgi:hypothetical protein